MTDYIVNYKTNFLGLGTGINSTIISRGVLDLSSFSLPGLSDVSDANEFFDAFSTSGRSFSYSGTTLTLRFSDGTDSHSIAISGFGLGANADFRIKTDANSESDFLVSQLAHSLQGQRLTAVGDAGYTLDGNSGADTLFGSAGADTIDGHSGYDTASYYHSSGAITYDATADADAEGFRAVAVDGAGADKLKSIERIAGSIYGDTFTLSADDGISSALAGLAGDDKFTIEFDSATASTNGYFGDDISGGPGSDALAFSGTNNAGALVVNLYLGTMSITVDGVVSSQSVVDFETLDLKTGSYGSDKAFTFIGNAANNDLSISNEVTGKVILNAGGGYDTLDLSDKTEGVTINQFSFARTLDGDEIVAYELSGGGFAAGSRVRNFEEIIGTAGDDVIFSNFGNDKITGGAGDDRIVVGNGNNRVDGEAGDDYIVIGRGNDILEGGSGSDTIDYSGNSGGGVGLTIDLKDADEGEGDSQGVAVFSRGGEFDKITNIENIVGTNARDILSGNSADNALTGGQGWDVLSGFAGADTLIGGLGNDMLDGGAGEGSGTFVATVTEETDHQYNYEVVAGDTLEGGAGDDVIKFSGRGDVSGGAGYDTLDLSGATAFKIENDDADYGFFIGISTSSFNQRISGWNGKAFGTASSDLPKLADVTGFEKAIGSDYGDHIYALDIAGVSIDHILEGGLGDDEIRDGSGDSVLRGGAGNDELDSGLGEDELFGGAGNDELRGTGGNNKLYGGTGADTYVLNVQQGEGKETNLIDDIDAGTEGQETAAKISTIVFSRSPLEQKFDDVAAVVAAAVAANEVVSEDAKAQAVLAEKNYNFVKSDNDLQIIYFEDSVTEIRTTIKDFFKGNEYLNYEFSAIAGDRTYNSISGEAFKKLEIVKTGADGTIASALTGAQGITGSFSDDTLTGRDNTDATAIDTLLGLAGDDTISGRAGADIIDGGTGTDSITGGAGADIIDGGRGVDTVNYFESLDDGASGITYDFTNAGAAYVGVGGDAAGDKLSNVERIISTSAGDHITLSTGTGNANGNDIRFVSAKGGDDIVEIDLTSATRNGIQIYGGGGSDTLALTGVANSGIKSMMINLATGKLTFTKTGDARVYSMDIGSFENVELTDAVHFGKWTVRGTDAANTVTLRGENSRTEGVADSFGVVNAPRNLAQLDGRIIFGGGNDRLVLDATRVDSDGERVHAATNNNLDIQGGAGTDTITFANTHIGAKYWNGDTRGSLVELSVRDGDLYRGTVVNLGSTGLQQGFDDRWLETPNDSGGTDKTKISESSARFSGIENLEASKESNYVFYGDSGVANRFTSLEDTEFEAVSGSIGAPVNVRGIHNFISYGGPADTFSIAETRAFDFFANANVRLFSASGNDKLAKEEAFSADSANSVEWSFAFAKSGVTVDLDQIYSGSSFGFDMDKITGSNHADTITTGGRGVEVVDGGGGNDVITGGIQIRVLRGGAGDDRLISYRMTSDVTPYPEYSQGAKGFMYGGAGDDVFEPTQITGKIGLKLDGEAGTDTVDFSHDNLKYSGGEGLYLYAKGIGSPHSKAKLGFGVEVTIGGEAKAYKVGTSVTALQLVRTMTSIENAIGTSVDDILTGNSVDNKLEGRGGADILTGGAGDDILLGGVVGDTADGGDTLDGGAGADTIQGFYGDDVLIGGDSLALIEGSDGSSQAPTSIGGKDDFLRPDKLGLGFFKVGNAAKNILQGNLGEDTYVIAKDSVNEIADGDAGAVIDFTAAGNIALGGNGGNAELLARFLLSDVTSSFTNLRNGNDLVILITQTDEVSTGDTASDTKTSTFSSYLTTTDSYETITTIKNFYLPGVAARYTFKFSGTDDTRAGNEAPVDVIITGRELIAAASGNGDIDLSEVAVVPGAIWQIAGSASRDVMKDNDGSNVMYGLNGYDTLTGNGGDDTIYGGNGADMIYGGAGADTIYGYEDARPGVAAETNTGASTNDVLRGGAGNDVIYGNKGNDEIYGGDDADTLYGNDGDDVIYGGLGDDIRLDGGAGRDTIYGSTQARTESFVKTITKIYGGAGDDTILAAVAGGFVVNDSGGNSIDEESGFIDGGDGHDTIYGSAFKDTIFGGAGDDTIDSGDGGDSVYGGYGNDEITGGAGADYFLGLTGTDTMFGMGGADMIYGGFGKDKIYGGDGDDTLHGDEGLQGLRTDADYLEGGAGNDLIRGGAGDDRIFGGVGIDTIYGESNQGSINANVAGNDYIDGGADKDVIDGQLGDDTILGGTGNDFLAGGAGADTFLDLGVLVAKPAVGNTPAKVISGLDTVDGGGGVDTVNFFHSGSPGSGIKVDLSTVATIANVDKGAGTVSIVDFSTVIHNNGAASGSETKLAYLKNVENIYGTRYADEITGSTGDNLIRGNAGSDTLSGGGGSDRLEGGYGVDTYKITPGSQTVISDIDSSRGSARSTIDLTDLATIFIDSVVGKPALISAFIEADGVEISKVGNDLVLEIATNVGGVVTTLLTVENFYNAPRYYDFKVNTNVAIIEFDGSSFSFGNTAKRFAGANEAALTGAALKNDDLVGRGNADEGDTLSGLSGNDKLAGLAGDDTLLGGKGGDVLIGGPGADVLDGGSGFDTAVYSYSAAGISLDLAKSAGIASAGGTGGQAAGDTLKDVEKIIGSNYADSIAVEFDTQEAIKYEVVAGSGLDSLTVNFGTAAAASAVKIDINFDGGVGIDTLILAGKLNLGAASNALSLNLGADAIQLGAVSLKNVENIDLTGFTSNADVVGITGSSVANTLTLGDLTSVRVSMLAGNDFVHIGDAVKGITGLDGGAGIDRLDFSSRTLTKGITLDLATGTIQDNEDTTVLTGGAGSVAGFENVVGSLGADTLTGGAGANILFGGLGNDILKGGAGNDILNGAEGVDTVSYRDESVGVNIALQGATNAIFSRVGSREFDQIRNVENIYGSKSNDILTGNAIANEIIGFGGNDVIRGGDGNDDLRGVDGDDTIYGNLGNDEIKGGVGNDTLGGGAGDDLILGGEGNDVIRGGAGNDNLQGEAGKDTIYTDAGIETINAGADDDTIKFAAAGKYVHAGETEAAFDVDIVDGGGGNDLADFSLASFRIGNVHHGIKVILSNVGGTDVDNVNLNVGSIAGDKIATLDNIEHISGTEYNDFITGNDADNIIFGNGKGDTISGKAGDDTIDGGTGWDTIYGGAGDDVIVGGLGNDTIDGGAGNDILHGGSHDDTIDGGAGDDTIYGGAGNDILSIGSTSTNNGHEYLYGGAGNDELHGGTSALSVNHLLGGAGNDDYVVSHGLFTKITDGDGLSKIDLTSLGTFSGLSAGDNQGVSNLLTLLKFGTGANDDFTYVRKNGHDLTLTVMKDNKEMKLDINDFYRGAYNYDFVIKHGDGENDKVTINGREFINIFDALELRLDDENLAPVAVLSDGRGNDALIGRDNADLVDELLASEGNDRLAGFAGADIIDGGAGIDTVDYRTSDAGVTMTLSATAGGLFTGVSGGHASGRVQQFNADGTPKVDNGENVYLAGVESIKNVEIVWGSQPVGGGFGDTFTLSARDAVDYIVQGYSGADKFTIDFANAAGNYLGDKLYAGGHVDSLALRGSNTAGEIAINFFTGVMTLTEGTNTRSSIVAGFENLNLAEYTSLHYLSFTGTADNNKVTLGGFETTGVLTLVGGRGIDTLDFTGRTTDLTVNLGAASTAVYGTVNRVSGFEHVVGGTGVNILTGNNANNVLTGGVGADILSGGGGNDILIGGGNNTLSSGKDYDILSGGAGDDRLLGGANSDLLRGGIGNDYIDGGEGYNTIIYSGERSGVQITLRDDANGKAVAATFRRFGSGERDTIKNVDHIYGSDVRDVLTGNSNNNVFNGLGGNDTLIGGAGDDILNGGDGNDTLTGGPGNDTLTGGDGNDILHGGVGYNILTGDAGNDVFQFVGINDATSYISADKDSLSGTAVGGAGTDTLDFSNSYFADINEVKHGIIVKTLNSGSAVTLVTSNNVEAERKNLVKVSEIENVIGTQYADTITGSAGDNTLTGGGGRDVLDGGDGDDVLYGGDGVDDLNGRAGDDIIHGNRGGDVIRGHGGTNMLYGGLGYDSYTISTSGSVNTVFDIGGEIWLAALAGDIKASTTVSAFVNHEGFDFSIAGQDWTLTFTNAGVTTTLTIKNFNLYFANYNFTFENNVTFTGNQLRNYIIPRDIVSNSDTKVEGSLGANTMTGGVANQIFHGLAGNDRLLGHGGVDALYGEDGDDIIYGGDGGDFLSGGAGNDLIGGGRGGDTIAGEDGDDKIVGLGTAGSGTDIIDGGAGQDSADFSHAGAAVAVDVTNDGVTTSVLKSFGVTFDFSASASDVAKDITGGRGEDSAATYASLKNVEDIVASGHVDTITLKISDGDSNKLSLGAHNDKLILKDASIVLTDKQDIYEGGAGTDTLDLSGMTSAGITNHIVLGNFDVPFSRQDFFADAAQTPADNLIQKKLGTAGKNTLASEASRDTILNGGAGYDTYAIAETVAYTFTKISGGDVTVKDSETRINDNGGLIDLTAFSGLSEDGARDFLSDDNVFARISSAGHLTLFIDNGDTENYIVINNFASNANAFSFKLSDDVSYRGDALRPYMVGANDGHITRSGTDGVDLVAILRGFENVVGSDDKDYIFGSDAANSLYGGGGNDIIFGDNLGDSVTLASHKFSQLSAKILNNKEDIVSGNDIIYGGAGRDVLVGMGGNDRLYGGAGGDDLWGGDGDDYFEGGAGGDFINGDLGVDTLSYAASEAGVSVDGSLRFAQQVIGFRWVVKANVAGAKDGKVSHADGDSVKSVDNFIGSAFADTLIGNNDADVEGSTNGQAGSTFRPDPGDLDADLLTYQSWQTTTSEILNPRGPQDGNEAKGANRLVGGAGDDIITGLGGRDTLLGGDGNDILTGDGAAVTHAGRTYYHSYVSDIIDGGKGIDTVSYRGESVGVNIALRGAVNAVFSRVGSREFDQIRNVENIYGSESNDILTGNAIDNEIIGFGGNDVIRGNLGDDDLRGVGGDDTIYGGKGNDDIQGGTGNDVLRGGAGNDNLKGEAGKDTIHTDAGIETIDAGAGDDTIEFAAAGSYVHAGETVATLDVDIVDGGEGNDLADFSLASFRIGIVYHGIKVDLSTADGTAIADVTLNEIESVEKIATLDNIEHVYGTEYKDVITGNDGDNIIFGNGRGDTISGGEGADIIDGGTGWDTIDGGADADTIDGGAGNDIIDGGDGNDILRGGSHDDTIDGEGGHDEIYGGDGIDTIYGGAGNDSISGGEGNDHLHGGLGENILTGGANFDTYYITENSKNTITDIAGLIDFTNLGNIVNANGLETFLTGLHANTGNLGSAVGFDSTGLTLKIGKAAANTGDDPILTSIRIDGFTLENAGSFSFRFSGTSANYIITGKDITNILYSTQTATTAKVDLVGTIFTDRLNGNIEANVLSGGDGGDRLFGGGGADTLDGGAGNDLLVGGAGGDTIYGGDGMDTVSYAGSAQAVSLMLTADQTATGFAGTGGQANGDVVDGVEKFIGSQYADSFSLAVADVTKAYILDGGLSSADTLKLTGTAATAFALDLAAGTFTIGTMTSTISNIERIDISSLTTTGGQAVITGIARADYITIGDADSAYTNIAGITGDLGKGWDTLYLGDYNIDSVGIKSSIFTLTGGIGVDTVDFSARADDGATFYFADRGFEQAIGSKQGDRFYSDDNANNINGGAGIDTIDYSEAGSSVVVNLGLGNSGVQSGSVASQGDILANIENIVGSAHADTIIGSRFNNLIEGGAGADTINGGAGIDTVSYAGSSDGVDVNLNVILRIGLTGYGYGSGGDADGDRLLNIENIIGSAGADTLTGNGQNNRLEGGAGNDILNGGGGADTLLGGAGTDTLNGGAGVDTYLVKAGDGSSNTIVDSGGVVRFDFTTAQESKDGNNLKIADGTGADAASFTLTGYFDTAVNTDTYTIEQLAADGSYTAYAVTTT